MTISRARLTKTWTSQNWDYRKSGSLEENWSSVTRRRGNRWWVDKNKDVYHTQGHIMTFMGLRHFYPPPLKKHTHTFKIIFSHKDKYDQAGKHSCFLLILKEVQTLLLTIGLAPAVPMGKSALTKPTLRRKPCGQKLVPTDELPSTPSSCSSWELMRRDSPFSWKTNLEKRQPSKWWAS